uniref:Pyridoxamine 5'-phosphate oxidase n=1 Tax=Enterobacter agglomerans TaxID=549 RepID=D7GL56_ENTAG|nr:hypothetical protein [Pantoea agglomerans]
MSAARSGRRWRLTRRLACWDIVISGACSCGWWVGLSAMRQGVMLPGSAWRELPQHTQQTYTGGPPGEVRVAADERREATAVESGASRFGVVIVRVSVLDAYQLQRNDNQRALFHYSPHGSLQESEWLNP